jgi:hypothetical protein
VYYHPARGEYFTVTGSQHHPTAGCQDNALHLGELCDDVLFAVTKPLLALYIEDPGYIRSRPLLDDMIGIEELGVQRLRQQTPDRALAYGHQSNEKNVLHAHKKAAPEMAPLV